MSSSAAAREDTRPPICICGICGICEQSERSIQINHAERMDRIVDGVDEAREGHVEVHDDQLALAVLVLPDERLARLVQKAVYQVYFHHPDATGLYRMYQKEAGRYAGTGCKQLAHRDFGYHEKFIWNKSDWDDTPTIAQMDILYANEVRANVEMIATNKVIASRNSGDNSSSNETTKDDSSKKPASEEVYIIAALQMNESNNQLWNAVREAVAQEGIDLNLFYQTSQNDMVRAYESGVANMYIGMSKAFFTESPMFLVTPDEIDETARRFEDFLENTCPVGYMSFTPVYLCSDKISSVDELPEGASVNISPNMSSLDSTYMIRSLKLLEKAGLITLKDQSELTGDDYSGFNFYIKDNYKEIKLSRWPVEEILNDLTPFDAFTVLGETYGNVLFEDPFQNDPDYWEQIWVNKELTSDPAALDVIEKIVEAYQSEANLEYVENPVGWDVDLIGQYR